jgi:predicted DNA-binding WGR domain protein
MRIYMQTQNIPGEPLRFYQLQLQPDLLGGWDLIRESGVQGGRGQAKRQYFETWDEAEKALIKLRDMQLKRGYRVVFREGVAREA